MESLNADAEVQSPEEEMPVDVVEHELVPQIPKDPLDSVKGTESPFAGDGDFLLINNDD